MNTQKTPRNKLLGALFAAAAKNGIKSDEIRDVIAPSVIGKRLSVASVPEIMRVVEKITGKQHSRPKRQCRYPSSKAGLLLELKDIARARWGEKFEKPLNAFINSKRKKLPTHYLFLNVAGLIAIKKRIKKMNSEEEIG